MTAAALTTEQVVASGYATERGARRAARQVQGQKHYAHVTLDVRQRPSEEWARIDIVKPEFVIVSLPKES